MKEEEKFFLMLSKKEKKMNYKEKVEPLYLTDKISYMMLNVLQMINF